MFRLLLVTACLAMCQAHMFMDRLCDGCTTKCSPNTRENSMGKVRQRGYGPYNFPMFIKLESGGHNGRRCKGYPYWNTVTISGTGGNCGNVKNMVMHGKCSGCASYCWVNVSSASGKSIETSGSTSKCLSAYDARQNSKLFMDPGSRGDHEYVVHFSSSVCNACKGTSCTYEFRRVFKAPGRKEGTTETYSDCVDFTFADSVDCSALGSKTTLVVQSKRGSGVCNSGYCGSRGGSDKPDVFPVEFNMRRKNRKGRRGL